MKRVFAAAATCAALCAALPAAAQFAKPEDAVRYRQNVMWLMSNHFGRVGAMVQGKVPFDAKAAADNADLVAMFSRLPYVAYVPGTESIANTKALPEVWSQRDKFDAAASNFQDKAAKLDVAAKSGNLDQIKTAFGDAAQSCKACHDNFRAK
jgi:cytochrome c556